MMTAVLLIVGLVAVAVAVFVVFNRRAAGKVANLGRAQLGKIGRKAEETDPIGQMRQAADDAERQIITAREALIRAEGAKSALERQVKSDQAEVSTLTVRINRRLDLGATATDPEVSKLGADLARSKRYLGQNQAQLTDNTKLCNEALAIIKRENEKIADLKHEADRLEVRLDVSKAQAAVAEVADQLHPGGVEGIATGAAKFREIAEKQIDQNNARLHVISQMSGTPAEEEVDADGATALDEIVKSRQHTAA